MLNFIGIGAQKSGTTWLYKALSLSPLVKFPGGKEVHFWNANYEKGLNWYKNLFTEPGRIHGDITPAYGILQRDIIAEVYQNFPNARLFFIIRNPLERAWSSALMALKRAEMTFDEASDQWFIDHFKSKGSLARGDYESCLKNWLSFYPRNSLLTIRYEHLASDPVLLAEKCFAHIGLKFNPTREEKSILTQRVFPGSGHEIRPNLHEYLKDLYHGKIMSLSSYLGSNLDEWTR